MSEYDVVHMARNMSLPLKIVSYMLKFIFLSPILYLSMLLLLMDLYMFYSLSTINQGLFIFMTTPYMLIALGFGLYYLFKWKKGYGADPHWTRIDRNIYLELIDSGKSKRNQRVLLITYSLAILIPALIYVLILLVHFVL